MTAMADQECTGSFSFIFSAEWDYVAKPALKAYTRDRYSLSLTRRLDMISAVKMLLDHRWVPGGGLHHGRKLVLDFPVISVKISSFPDGNQ